MTSCSTTRGLLFALLTALFVAATVGIARHSGVSGISAGVFQGVRWIAIGLLAAYALAQGSLTAWILVGLAAGAELGHDAPAFAMKFQVLGTIFLRLIKVILAPLLFGTLVVGIAGHADIRKVGRMGIKAIVYFEIVSKIAIFIGLAAINISRAGVGIQLPASASETAPPVVPRTATDLILNVFPENIAKSVAEGQVLQVVVFSILFGIALAMVPEEKRRPLVAFAESLSETMFKFTNIVMLAAPLGVFGSIAYTVGHMGLGVLLPLLKLLATMYVAHRVFQEGSYPAILASGCRAGNHRVCHGKLGGGAAESDGKHGNARRSALDRRLCVAYRVQLQSGRIKPLSIARSDIHGPSCWHPSHAWAASPDDDHVTTEQ